MLFFIIKQAMIVIRQISLVLILMFVFIPLSFAQTNYNKKKELIVLVKKAQETIDGDTSQGDYLVRASNLLGAAIEIDSNYAPIYVEAARLILVGGSIPSSRSAPQFKGNTLGIAESYLKRAISLDPRYPDSYVLMGHVTRMMGVPDLALSNLNKAVELKSKNPWLLNNLGAYYQDLSEIDKATDYYSKAINSGVGKDSQQRNSYIDAATKLQWYAALKDDNKNVIKYGKLATDAAPPYDAWTWANVGNMLFVQGFFDEAETHAKKALSIMNFGHGRGVLALALYGKWAKAVAEGRPDKGEIFFEMAYRLNPDLDDVAARFSRAADFMKTYIPIVQARQAKLLKPFKY